MGETRWRTSPPPSSPRPRPSQRQRRRPNATPKHAESRPDRGILGEKQNSPRRRAVRVGIFLVIPGKKWYAREDSNLWPFGPQPNALSTELRARMPTASMPRPEGHVNVSLLAGRQGFEPWERFNAFNRLAGDPD